MVGTPLAKIPSEKVLNLLKHSKLMEEINSTGEFKITNEGFQFLLQEINSQLWTLLLQYLKVIETSKMDLVDVLHFIFMLGALEVGKAYKIDALSETQRIMLQDMRDYGLVFQKHSNDTIFYPTKLALMLTSDTKTIRSASNAMDSVLRQNREEPSVTEDGNNGKPAADINIPEDLNKVDSKNQDIPDGSLIVETNFKIYSYSNSPLQIAVLSLFVHLKARFVNMVLGQITRESIRRALTSGITADQIRLWQLELDRVMTYDGSLYSDFETTQEYSMLNKYAQDIGVLLWKDDKKRKFFISKEGNSQVLDFAKRKLKKKQ